MDIYRLTEEDFLVRRYQGEIGSKSIVHSASKENSAEKLLFGLGVQYIEVRQAATLQHFHSQSGARKRTKTR